MMEAVPPANPELSLPRPLSPLSPPPSPADGRLGDLDVLRGFALLGILIINLCSMAMPATMAWYPASYAGFTSWSNWLPWVASEIFCIQKFYPLFAMLFGAGIVLMAGRTEAQGGRPARRHYRRMFALLALGVLHLVLLWYGDILHEYALCGMLVYPLWRLRPRVLFPVAIALMLLTLGIYGRLSYLQTQALGGDDFLAGAEAFSLPEPEDPADSLSFEIEGYRAPWSQQWPLRLTMAWNAISGWGGLWRTMGLMVLGMALVKTGWLGGPRGARFDRWVVVAACGTGWLIAAGGLLWWWWRGFDPYRPAANFVLYGIMPAGGHLAALGYAAALRAWGRSGRLVFPRRVLAALGRTALSNYLLQSVLGVLIFHGEGLGLFAQVSRAGLLGVVLGIWLVQIVLTLVWLKFFRQGPVEAVMSRWVGRSAE